MSIWKYSARIVRRRLVWRGVVWCIAELKSTNAIGIHDVHFKLIVARHALNSEQHVRRSHLTKKVFQSCHPVCTIDGLGWFYLRKTSALSFAFFRLFFFLFNRMILMWMWRFGKFFIKNIRQKKIPPKKDQRVKEQHYTLSREKEKR